MPRAAACLTCLAALLTALPLRAEEIDTDRPDFVESSAVVGKGRFQLETSVAGDRDNAGGLRLRSTSTPTLLRLGISDDLELRLETDGLLHTSAFDPASGLTVKDHGWADTSIGVKWHTRDGDAKAGTPATAWLLHADLDTGSKPYRGQGVRPSLRFVAEWDLPGDTSLGVMPGFFVDRNDDGKHYVGGIAAVTVSTGWGHGLRSFAEIAAQRIARARDGGSVLTLDVGGQYLITDNVQLDAGFFFGLNRDAPNFAWTTGVSIKF